MVANSVHSARAGTVELSEGNSRDIHLLRLVLSLLPELLWRRERPHITLHNTTVVLHHIHTPDIFPSREKTPRNERETLRVSTEALVEVVTLCSEIDIIALCIGCWSP